MARKPAESVSHSDKFLSRRVLIQINRADDVTTSTPRVAWEHEKPILEAIFGEGSVEDLDPSVLDEGYTSKPDRSMIIHQPAGGKQDVIPRPSESAGIGFVFFGDAQSEYERLKSVYGSVPDEDGKGSTSAVILAYGRFNERKFSTAIGTPELSDLPDAQLIQLVHSYGQAIPDGATRAELLALAEEAGAELV